MAGASNYSAQAFLNWLTGKTAMPTLPTAYVALFTAVGTDAGTGFTELAATAYARKSTAGSDWNAASGTSPSTVANANAITFTTVTSSGSDVIAFGLYDASTSGNLLEWDYLGNNAWLPFSCTSATPGVITSPAHGLSNGDKVVVNAEVAGTLPATGGSWSGLLTVANVTTDTFTVGVNTTGTGAGLVRKVVPQSIVSNLQVSFAAGALTLAGA